MPSYEFNPADMGKNRIHAPNSFKNISAQYIMVINDQLGLLAEVLNDEVWADALTVLENIQETAITLGNYTEQIKGEGHDLVGHLELLCEDVFKVYEPVNALLNQKPSTYVEQNMGESITPVTLIDDGRPECDLNNDSNVIIEQQIEEAYAQLDGDFADLVSLYDKREETLFICLRPEYFNNFRSLYNEAIADENRDVFVIPIPFVTRNYDGSVKKNYYSQEGYPEDVKVYDCQSYNVAIHEPETIVIQYAHDGYADHTGIPAAFYSLNLRPYTDKLLLIPYREPADFDEDEFRPYYNMKFYATQPAVMCADEVWLYSDKLRGLYIKKLTEFAGEDTRSIWEEKIKVKDRPKAVELPAAPSEIRKFWDSCREELGEKWVGADGRQKKILLYQPVFSSFAAYGEEMIDKLKRNFEIFRQSGENVTVLWLEQLPMKRDLAKINPQIARDYRDLVEDFEKEEMGIFVSDAPSDNEYHLPLFMEKLEQAGLRKGATMERIAIEIADAYYGDGDYVARQFTLEKKPVMIQNISI